MKVDDWMTREVISVTPTTSAWDALETMRSAGIHEMPVLEGGQVVGMVTDGDLNGLLGDLALRPPGEHMRDAHGKALVRACMSSPAHPIRAGTRMSAACQLMADRRIGALPVVDGEGRLVGILSVTDVLRAAAQVL